MSSWKPDICVYHGGCDDGFGAALAVWKRWGDAVEYVPAGYSNPLNCNPANKHIIMVDFSLKREAMRELGNRASSVVVPVFWRKRHKPDRLWRSVRLPNRGVAAMSTTVSDVVHHPARESWREVSCGHEYRKANTHFLYTSGSAPRLHAVDYSTAQLTSALLLVSGSLLVYTGLFGVLL